MINLKYNKYPIALITTVILLFTASCTKDLTDLELADFPDIPEVFIDGFSPGLEYAVFGGASLTAFDVDLEIKYKGTESMRFGVPNNGDPGGSYVGGAFYTTTGRNLTRYDALTFWGRASEAVSVDEISFGVDLEDAKNRVTFAGVEMNSNWKKYIIPLPDPSRLTQERGMISVVATPKDGKGYTFWLDEVRFEQLGTLAHPKAAILDGQDQVIPTENGNELPIGGLKYTVNLSTGVDQSVFPAADYFTFNSSDPSVASVNNAGVVSVLSEGTSVITATLGGEEAEGSMTVQSSGQPVGPMTRAPIPDEDPGDVISIFSNAYPNEPVDFFNGYWEFSTTQSFDYQVDGDDIIRYTNLNFVGIQFTSPTIDITSTNTFHMDIWTQDQTEPVSDFKILLVDLGPDGNFGGDDDASHELTITNPTLKTEEWISLDIPLSSFAGLTTRGSLAQIVLSSGTIKNVFVDNIYFYQGENMGGDPIPPDQAAPTPTQDAADVVSVYSDAYDDISVEGFNLYGTADFQEESINGNNALKYTGTPATNFQVIEFGGSNQIDAVANGLTHFHFDLWFPNAVDPTSAFLMKLVDINGGNATEALINISPSSNPAMEQGKWISFDIPFSELEANGLGGKSNLQQVVIDLVNAGQVYIDNIYFYKDDGSGGGPIPPTSPAPTPTQDAGDVVSIYSDAYDNVPNEGFALYGTAAFEEVTIEGNNALKYTGTPETNFQVIELGGANQIDAEAAGLTTFHFDLWFPNELTGESEFLLKLVDIPAGGATEALIYANNDSNPAIAQGTWLSFDIPFTELETLGLGGKSNIQQVVVDLINTGEVYIDNIYLYK